VPVSPRVVGTTLLTVRCVERQRTVASVESLEVRLQADEPRTRPAVITPNADRVNADTLESSGVGST
jgi:hypothetical protein